MKLLFFKKSNRDFEEFAETKSIQVCASAEELYLLGRFFVHCAQTLEEMGEDFGHMHLQDFENVGRPKKPDIIVFPKKE